MLKHLQTYYQVWFITASNALQRAFVNRWTNVLFILGKVLRLGMSLLFLYLLKERNITIAGYTTDQVIVFFLTYQFIDIVAQVLYRGVYNFGRLIKSGEFDFYLARPISALFRSLTGEPDINDVFFLVPSTVLSIWLIAQLPLSITVSSVLLYLVVIINSLLIATGLHILVLVVGIVTTEVDNIIWTYRDITRLGQFPVTMYVEPLRTALFFILPVGFMYTIPAQVLLGSPLSFSIPVTLGIGVVFFWITLKIWAWGLQRYSSASS
ncbi:MAG TPA: ABC-2 family transporter protein [Vitreimonas sp.]|nr:ABC-2 family transporter protein [Vitreimonas sp.]